MTDDDEVLKALKALDAPAHDTRFHTTVMGRIARRRLGFELTYGLAGLAIALLVLALSGPQITALMHHVSSALHLPLAMLVTLVPAAGLGHRLTVRGVRLPRTWRMI